MPVAATNTSANSALFYLNRNSSNQEAALNRISSGTRITNSADDTAGLAISDQLQADITALEQAAITTQQVESLLQIADGGLARVGDILQRMKALAVQDNSGTVDATSQGFIATEYAALAAQIATVAAATDYNGTALIDGTGVATVVVVGVNATDTITLGLNTINATQAGLTFSAALGGGTPVDITNADNAINNLGGFRSTIGSLTSRIQFQGENIQTQLTNLKEAKSAIFDADIALEQTNFTNFQVLTEAAIASLSQANQAKQSLLSLLR
jgi:flagellin